jgi:hypothetical protein
MIPERIILQEGMSGTWIDVGNQGRNRETFHELIEGRIQGDLLDAASLGLLLDLTWPSWKFHIQDAEKKARACSGKMEFLRIAPLPPNFSLLLFPPGESDGPALYHPNHRCRCVTAGANTRR